MLGGLRPASLAFPSQTMYVARDRGTAPEKPGKP